VLDWESDAHGSHFVEWGVAGATSARGTLIHPCAHDGDMFESHHDYSSDAGSPGDVHLDCQTCVAVNTTACADCIVSHLLANDDGPIEVVPIPVELRELVRHDPVETAIGLFARAGLIDDEPVFVDVDEFESGRVPELAR